MNEDAAIVLRRRQRAAQAIRDAVERLDECGWRQHTIRGPDGSLCVRGALNFALVGHSSVTPCTEAWEAQQVAENAILAARLIPFPFERLSVPKWNDSMWQRYSWVRRTMLRAADRLGR